MAVSLSAAFRIDSLGRGKVSEHKDPQRSLLAKHMSIEGQRLSQEKKDLLTRLVAGEVEMPVEMTSRTREYRDSRGSYSVTTETTKGIVRGDDGRIWAVFGVVERYDDGTHWERMGTYGDAQSICDVLAGKQPTRPSIEDAALTVQSAGDDTPRVDSGVPDTLQIAPALRAPNLPGQKALVDSDLLFDAAEQAVATYVMGEAYRLGVELAGDLKEFGGVAADLTVMCSEDIVDHVKEAIEQQRLKHRRN